MRRREFVAALAGVMALSGALLVFGKAQAQQTYPTHTVRLILPFGPGSASDTTARLFADRLTARWGKPVVVENRPGGDGLVALKVFVDAHDDHTLFFGPAAEFLDHLYDAEAPPYALSDIVPISGVFATVLAISVPAEMNIHTMDELVARARAEPGKLNVGAATGNADFLIFGFFKDMKLQVTRVPYRDIMQAPNDLSENRIQVLATSLAAVQSTLQTGRIKVLLVTSRKHAETAPEIPTAAEAGYPQLTMETIGGLFGPKDMPQAEREGIAADLRDIAAHDPIINQRMVSTGQIMTLLDPTAFAANIKEQNDQLGAIAKTLGFRTQQ
jgi:tripartite-type tricarboxylate transporter receptor subunit TctC